MHRVLLPLLVVLVVAVSSSLLAPTAHSQTVEAVASVAKPSVAVILAKGPSGVQSGTAFMAADRLVLTAYHVVQSATQILLKFPDYPAVNARLVQWDTENDVAALSIPFLPVRPLPLGDISQVREGQTIVVVGFPRIEVLGAASATVTEGIVSAIRPGMIQMQVPISPGNSGGPVLNLQGEVVGLVRGTLRGEQQGINFATAINAARPLLASVIAPLPAPSMPQEPAPPQPAPAPSPPLSPSMGHPVWIPGDTWTYEARQGDRTALMKMTILGGSADTYSVRYQTPQKTWVESILDYVSPIGEMKILDGTTFWPLSVGKHFNAIILTYSVQVSIVVEALEEVTVPAGTFRALRLIFHACAREGCGDMRQWIAPEVKGVVKWEISDEPVWQNLKGFVMVLTSYEVNR